MTYREAHVLKGLVEEYIRTAHPVGSSRLVEILKLDISSATIRNILRLLEEEEYVVQPHTSAGRIPTDKGYRYYVDNLVFKEPNTSQVKQMTEQFKEYRSEYERPSRATAKLLSNMTRAIAVSGWLDEDDIQEAGLRSLLAWPEEGHQHVLEEVMEFVEDIDRSIEELAEQPVGAVSIYIGHENPVANTRHTSMLVQTVELSKGKRVVLLLMGPKNMPYQRNVALLSGVSTILKNSSL